MRTVFLIGAREWPRCGRETPGHGAVA